MRPITRDKFAHPVKQRAGRAEAKGRQNRVPGQHPEYVAMRGDHRVFDDVPDDFTARQVRYVDVLPLRQKLPRAFLAALVKRIADAGEVMAELPKPQRQVQKDDIPQHRERHAQGQRQQPVNTQRQQGRHAGRKHPRHPAVVCFARIEIAADPAYPDDRGRIHRVAIADRANLLDQ